jgi:hypothetical protein
LKAVLRPVSEGRWVWIVPVPQQGAFLEERPDDFGRYPGQDARGTDQAGLPAADLRALVRLSRELKKPLSDASRPAQTAVPGPFLELMADDLQAQSEALLARLQARQAAR